jgi:1-deoxy-D-xylulose-5-phosphate reductoisomerase
MGDRSNHRGGGLKPTLATAERGAIVALANKECLVCAGGLFMRRAAAAGATVLPVDSEHNALFQAMSAGRRQDVRRVILTASGGPFRTWTAAAIRAATPEQALKHPNWAMGPKVTIDSATLMNKGLEVIEAHHLFALTPDEIDVLVHPQSIVRPGRVPRQLAHPARSGRRIPIAHCLAWPARISGPAPRLDLARQATLSFESPDMARFPALGLARRALEAGGGAPTVLNAANEVAVDAFLSHGLGFAGITALVEASLEAAGRRGLTREPSSIEDALAVDHESRLLTRVLLPEIAAKAS